MTTKHTNNKKLKCAVLISGRGSNLQALIDACKNPDFPAEIVGVISNKADAYGLHRAFTAGIPAMIVESAQFKGRPKQEFEQALLETMAPWQPDLVCLAGFMRLLSPYFIDAVQGKIINIHPSLLPKHKGMHPHRDAIATGDLESGCTVHWVTAEMDAGDAIVQKAVPIVEGDTEETLAARILTVEHLAYPEALRLLAENLFEKNSAQTLPSATCEIERAMRMWKNFARVFFTLAGGIAFILALMGLFLT